MVNMGCKQIAYTSGKGYKGILYNWHCDNWTGEWHYSMMIFDRDGKEMLHAYNASPKTIQELKNVVERMEEFEKSFDKFCRMAGEEN